MILYNISVRNDGSIFGLIIGKNTISDISREIKEHIRPIIISTINVIEVENKKIIKVEVLDDDKPYSAYCSYYIRSNDEDIIDKEYIIRVGSNKTGYWKPTINKSSIEALLFYYLKIIMIIIY